MREFTSGRITVGTASAAYRCQRANFSSAPIRTATSTVSSAIEFGWYSSPGPPQNRYSMCSPHLLCGTRCTADRALPEPTRNSSASAHRNAAVIPIDRSCPERRVATTIAIAASVNSPA